MSKFISDPANDDYDRPASDTTAPLIYHCVPVEPEGTAIKPSTNYGMTIPPEVRDELGMGEGHEPLVFAATHLTKALAFAMKGTGEGVMNGAIAGSDGEFYLTAGRDKIMATRFDATVFAFSSKGFVELPNAQRQCVSLHQVPFRETKTVLKANSPHDLMRAGLQILAFRETAAELSNGNREGCLIDKLMEKAGYKDTNAFLGAMVREGRLVWENQASGINPDPALAKMLGLDDAKPSTDSKPIAPRR